MAITAEKVEFARINSDIQQDDDDHETNASDSSEKLELKIEEKNEAQNEDEDEEPREDNNETDPHNGKNNGKPDDKGDDGDDGDDVHNEKKNADEDIVTLWEAMRKYVPFIQMVGWTVYLQALGEQFKNDEGKCDCFRMYIQWIYLSVCFIMTFVYYWREQRKINEDPEYRKKVNRTKKVHKWRYISSHGIVTILYLLTVSEQPFACHLPYGDPDNTNPTCHLPYGTTKSTTSAPTSAPIQQLPLPTMFSTTDDMGAPTSSPTTATPTYEEQLSYLSYIRLTVVSLTTVILKALGEISTDDDPDPPAPDPPAPDHKQ